MKPLNKYIYFKSNLYLVILSYIRVYICLSESVFTPANLDPALSPLAHVGLLGVYGMSLKQLQLIKHILLSTDPPVSYFPL